jgi:hypothetical protein
MTSSDLTFLALPQYLRRRIDRAFDSAVNRSTSQGPGPQKETEIDASAGISAGGFIPEPALPELGVGGGFLIDDSPTSGNGFMIEDDENDIIDIQSQIHMSAIPSALQLLDLPPDDDQVLSVFRNAASGWSSSSLDDTSDGGGMVSKEDWRAVCAVLFEHHAEEYEDSEDGGGTGYAVHNTSEADESDDYHDPYFASDDPNGGSDDEYVEGPSTSPSRRRPPARHNKSTSSAPGSPPSFPIKLTPRQTQTCLQAFALFFPSIAASELPNQKIMIKDIQRVAQVLGEKIKADEVSTGLPII